MRLRQSAVRDLPLDEQSISGKCNTVVLLVPGGSRNDPSA
jgi:hypothetical protein